MDVNNKKPSNIPSSSGISGWASSTYQWATGGKPKAKESEKTQEVVPSQQSKLTGHMDMPEILQDAYAFFQQKKGLHIKENSIELEGNSAAYNNFVSTLDDRSANNISLINTSIIYIGNYNWDHNFKTNINLLSSILNTVKDFECLKVGPLGSEKTITKADIQKIIDDSKKNTDKELKSSTLSSHMDMPEIRQDAYSFFRQTQGVHTKGDSIELEGNATAYNNFVSTLDDRSVNNIVLINTKTIHIGNYNWDHNFKTNINLLNSILSTVKDFECLKVGPLGSEKTITKADIQKIIDDSRKNTGKKIDS